MKLIASSASPPVGAVIASKFVTSSEIVVEWGKETSLQVSSSISLSSNAAICRYLARLCPDLNCKTPYEKTQIDHWLSFCFGPLVNSQKFNEAIKHIDAALERFTFLIGAKLSVADLHVYGALFLNPDFEKLSQSSTVPANVRRWFSYVSNLSQVKAAINSIQDQGLRVPKAPAKRVAQKDEGKFVELPGAEIGKVVVRFPPEASGYLHIGHAKAALLNWYYKEQFNGTLVMRFDDTNPDKEKVDFEEVILEDLKMLEIYPDKFTYTSQHFPLLLELCEKMLKSGSAYVDDTPPEQMKAEREARQPSRNRDNPVEKNLSMWLEMIKGSDFGQRCCVRAKIDMASDNGCMRDPTIYRCKNEPHPRTGAKYKVYPTYDFACPVVDSIEGVTHALRTMEYHDRDEQYYWFIEQLQLRKPYIWEYSRLNMMNTVLSKRKLTWFVEQGLVDSWEDPRFPTVRGVLRRGMTVQGLKQFIIAQGSSRSVVQMEWDKIWAFNKKVIDPVAPRYTALEASNLVTVNVEGAKAGSLVVPKHPKNNEIGTKTVLYGPKIVIAAEDAALLKEGENATFINWGNLEIKKLQRDSSGRVTEVFAQLNLSNTDFKKTLKLTWLVKSDAKLTPINVFYYDHIITKPVLGKDEDFKQYINKDSKKLVSYVGDPDLVTLKKGDIIQLQRIGFFRVDVAASSGTTLTLIHIPDGSSKPPVLSSDDKQGSRNAGVELTDKNLEEIANKWTADRQKSAVVETSAAPSGSLTDRITEQGNKVRQLKADKASKSDIDTAVKELLSLKQEYKAATGQEWKPGVCSAAPVVAPKITSPPVTTPSSGWALSEKIVEQGNIVRQLKADKAAKADVEAAVKLLLALKKDYQAETGTEWKPGTSPAPKPAATVSSASDVNGKIIEQGNLVRQLKADKASKSDIEAAVKTLLSLKKEYQAATGQEWKPGVSPPAAPIVQSTATVSSGSDINQKIIDQGNLVRQLKADKASKPDIESAVKILLSLKADYKSQFGKDWKPGTDQPQTPAQTQPSRQTQQGNKANNCESGIGGDNMASTPAAPATDLENRIVAQGDKIRILKAEKAEKTAIEAEVKKLLDLKAEFKAINGQDWKPQGGPPPRQAKEKKQEADKKPEKKGKDRASKEKSVEKDDEKGMKKQTRLGLEARKEDNLPDWYSQVITKGEMIEYYDVSGCYILRPWAFSVWEAIQTFLDKEIKKLGVVNAYFPMFVSKSVLEREKAHIADFAPEVAWVTKSGESDLAEHIAIRPTSETAMYPAYSKWIQSHRDLPLRLNQWNNVVRWEFKHPQPFLRTREFLWQEGHTAFASYKEAEEEVYQILDLYARVYTDLLAIPVVKGRKTEKEKFAGGDYTTTVEAFISASGRGIQGATSHHLGQNFSKMFDITVEDPESKEKMFVFQNSWGLTTRTIGVMIMVHADNQGLVMPPAVSAVQVVIVPCGVTASLAERSKIDLINTCKQLDAELVCAGIRSKLDERDNYSPGWKFNHWELKGVPLRIELGPKDLEKRQLVAVRRDSGEKNTLPLADAAKEIQKLLSTIQASLLARAEAELKDHTKIVKTWKDFCPILDAKNIILAPFCEAIECEENIKKDSARDQDLEPGAPAMGAKSLCIPFQQPAAILPSDKCIHPSCKKPAKSYTLFGRSY